MYIHVPNSYTTLRIDSALER